MTVLTVAGMIGAGKTTLTNLIADELGFKPSYEEVEGNLILPLFYTASEEEKEKNRYSFLLQLEFLNSRYSKMKQALLEDDVVLDRSIYEDIHFASVLNKRGEINDLEYSIYRKLFDNMMEELDELPKKSPDLLIYIKISFEKTLERIGLRGRDYEQDASLIEYYRDLWEDYDHWVFEEYDKSHVLVVDADKYDFLNNDSHREHIINTITKTYNSLSESFETKYI